MQHIGMKGGQKSMDIGRPGLAGGKMGDLVTYDPYKDEELGFLPPELREQYRESLKHNHNLLERLAKM
jgi:hypothetical protein